MLKNRRIVITRPREQSQPLVQALRLLGATPVVIPAISILPPQTWSATDKALHAIDTYSWLLFTSASAVTWFLERHDQVFESRDRLAHLRIGVIGWATRGRLESESLIVSLQPARATAEDLARELANTFSSTSDLARARALFPTSNIGRDTLPEILRSCGGTVDVIEVYRTEPAQIRADDLRSQFETTGVDDIVFASPSAVRSFVRAVLNAGQLDRLSKARIICIGKVTAAAAGEFGLAVDGVAEEPTVECIIQALLRSDLRMK